MDNDRSKLFFGFLLGVAAGAVAGYLLAGGKKEELEQNLHSASGKIRDELKDYLEKGEALLNDLAEQAGSLFEEKRNP
jgi:gas vesicle protein